MRIEVLTSYTPCEVTSRWLTIQGPPPYRAHEGPGGEGAGLRGNVAKLYHASHAPIGVPAPLK